MINMTHRANIDMRLVTFELGLAHDVLLGRRCWYGKIGSGDRIRTDDHTIMSRVL
jgi:hypothetical protein